MKPRIVLLVAMATIAVLLITAMALRDGRSGPPAAVVVPTTMSLPPPFVPSAVLPPSTPAPQVDSDVVPLGPTPRQEGEAEVEGRGSDGITAQRWPLTRWLPKSTRGWRIDYRIDADQLLLVVTLRPILNHGGQLERYQADLRRYKAEALDWLSSVGADASAYWILWLPAEAAAL